MRCSVPSPLCAFQKIYISNITYTPDPEYFGADEFGGYFIRDVGTKILSSVLLCEVVPRGYRFSVIG